MTFPPGVLEYVAKVQRYARKNCRDIETIYDHDIEKDYDKNKLLPQKEYLNQLFSMVDPIIMGLRYTKENVRGYLQDNANFDIAKLYVKRGNKEKAEEYYNKISEDFKVAFREYLGGIFDGLPSTFKELVFGRED